jgi:class 3 adenylate cyclase
VFINGPSKQVIAPIVADIRRRAAAAGRNHEPNPSRLAAILAADVVGYSRLMGADEEGTLETSQSAAP